MKSIKVSKFHHATYLIFRKAQRLLNIKPEYIKMYDCRESIYDNTTYSVKHCLCNGINLEVFDIEEYQMFYLTTKKNIILINILPQNQMYPISVKLADYKMSNDELKFIKTFAMKKHINLDHVYSKYKQIKFNNNEISKVIMTQYWTDFRNYIDGIDSTCSFGYEEIEGYILIYDYK